MRAPVVTMETPESIPMVVDDTITGTYTRVYKKCSNLKNTILGRKPVSIINYTRMESTIKRPTQNYKATLGHVNFVLL